MVSIAGAAACHVPSPSHSLSKSCWAGTAMLCVAAQNGSDAEWERPLTWQAVVPAALTMASPGLLSWTSTVTNVP